MVDPASDTAANVEFLKVVSNLFDCGDKFVGCVGEFVELIILVLLTPLANY